MVSTTNEATFTLTLPSDREIQMTRVFGAPRELVWEAITKPEHVRRWWGCSASTMTVCEIDFRVGGKWRFAIQMDGQEFGFDGVYREIEAPVKTVQTEVFEPMPEYEALTIVMLEEADGKTKLTSVTLHSSQEARDGHLQSGMEHGARQTYDRLEQLLAEF